MCTYLKYCYLNYYIEKAVNLHCLYCKHLEGVVEMLDKACKHCFGIWTKSIIPFGLEIEHKYFYNNLRNYINTYFDIYRIKLILKMNYGIITIYDSISNRVSRFLKFYLLR